MEFALVVPVLLLILLFAIDFGRAFYSWVILQNASRIGADYAGLNPDGWEGAGIQAIKDEYVARVSADWGSLGCALPPDPVFTDGADTSTGAQTPDTAYDVGDTVKVALTCPFSPLTPVVSTILGNTIQLGATSEFRIRAGDLAGLDKSAQIPQPSTATPTPVPTPVPTAGPTPAPTATPCTVTAAFSGAPTSGAGGSLTVQFTDLSTPSAGCVIASRAWNFGDGQTSTQTDPSHLFTKTANGQSQRFDVTLTVTLVSGGSDSELKRNYIRVDR